MSVSNESIYNCYSSYGCGCVNKPLNSDIVGPYVKLTFLSSEKVITVGNRPSPNSDNLASVKSFQYGSSDGVGAEVEIYDEQGGDFEFFVNRIVKNPSKALDLYKTVCQWGWITKDCNGNTQLISSKCHVFAILSVDISISGAKGIIFKLELFDLMVSLFETQVTEVFNNTLKQNIKDLFKRTNPPLTDIRFKRHKQNDALASVGGGLTLTSGCSYYISDAELDDMKLMGGSEDTKIECPGNNLTPLAAAREWIKDHRTDRNKGIIVFYDNVVNCTSGTVEPRVIFLEDPLPICYDEATACKNSIGTYIVNGGKDSPVISFEPKIKFNFSAAAHDSVVIGNETAKAARSSGQPCGPDGGGSKIWEGATAMVQVTAALLKTFGAGSAPVAALSANIAHERANKTYEAVEAELKIQGQPYLDDPFAIKIKTVSIIVVNPFRLSGESTGGSCPIWLAQPPCNKVLSNKSWFINGVSHEISAGSYTTTLKLFLPSPGTTTTI